VLADFAKNDKDQGVRKEAVARLTDQTIIADIAKNDSDKDVHEEAVAKLTDQAVIADIAKNDSNKYVRKKAVARLTDQAVLADIAKNDSDQDVRVGAFAQISDQDVLLHLAWYGPVGYMRTSHPADEDDSYEWSIAECRRNAGISRRSEHYGGAFRIPRDHGHPPPTERDWWRAVNRC
jgi:hypothetical protein